MTPYGAYRSASALRYRFLAAAGIIAVGILVSWCHHG